MAVYVIKEEEDPLQPPHDVGIVSEGVQVLNELPSVAHACATLFGLIYALNLSYPSEIKYTFDVLQKLFMEIEPRKMTRSVQYECQALSIGFRHWIQDVLFCVIACIQIYSVIKEGAAVEC